MPKRTQPEVSVEAGFLMSNENQGGISRGLAMAVKYDDAANYLNDALNSLLQTGRVTMDLIAEGGKYRFGSGSASAPSIAFAASTGLGLYHAAANTAAFVVGSSIEAIRFGAAEVVVNEAGIALMDLRVEGDTGTNLFFADASLDAVQIGTTVAGVIADFRTAAIVFNEDGADRDFRVEGDLNANLLFTDASVDRVFMGGTTTLDTDERLAVTGKIASTENLIFRSGTAFNGTLDHAIAAARTWTFPDLTGTVVLGTGVLNRVTFWNGVNDVTSDADFTWDPTANALTIQGNYLFKSATLFDGTLDHTITAARTWTFPDKTGTLALGTGVANRVAFWLDGNELTSDVDFTYDSTLNTLTIEGNYVFKSTTLFNGTLDHAITTARTWSFPDLTGTLVVGSGVANRLAIWTLANQIESDPDFTVDLVTNALTIGGNYLFKSGTSFDGTLDHAITAARTWTFPDATGTLVLGGGSGAADRIAFWSDSNTLTSEAALSWISANDELSFGDAAANSSAAGRFRRNAGNMTYFGGIACVDALGIISRISGVAATETVFNEQGFDQDFRVEGDTQPNLLTVDASADRIGVGKAVPASLLHLSVATYPQLEIDDNTSRNFAIGVTTSSFRIRDVTGAADRVTVAAGGQVGIGRVPTTNPLEVEGDASKTAAGDWLANSDIRLKTDIREIADALKVIQSLRPVRFRYTDEYKAEHPSIRDGYYCNFIAQEFREVFPESVKESAEGYLQMDSHNVRPYLVRALQELAVKVDGLASRLAELEAA